MSNALTDTQGFVARDEKRKEIVVSLRGRLAALRDAPIHANELGSASVTDILLDSQVTLVPFISPGVKLPGKMCSIISALLVMTFCFRRCESAQWLSSVVRRSLRSKIIAKQTLFCSWDALSLQTLFVVGKELEKHPGYSVVTTGHSLGGSIALLAAITLQQNFKATCVP